MKKIYTYIFGIATLLLGFASCQKEDTATTTFKARVENGSKVELNANGYFNWLSSDRVDINGSTFTVTPTDNNATAATLTGPNIGDGPYTAIYPASIVSNGQITLPTRQTTATGNLENFPMRAVSNNHDLQFYNLCSAIRIHMPGCEHPISRIEVVSSGSPISGACTIVEGNWLYTSHPALRANAVNNGGIKRITLDITNPQVYNTNEGHDFYITIPSLWYNSVFTFYFFTDQGLVCTRRLNVDGGFGLMRSQVTTLDFDGEVPMVFEQGSAQLKEFAFNGKQTITKIIFHYNSDEYSEEHVEAENSIPIYLKMDGTVCHVHTLANYIECPAGCNSLFANCLQLQSIEFNNDDENNQGFRTSNATNMCQMFNACQSLTSIDLSWFNTSNVTTFEEMFKSCSALTTLDLRSFNTSNATTMSNMFHGCTRLTNITFPTTFTTNNVTYMQFMFYNCNALTSLDLSHFNTTNVTTMESMFLRCQNLTSLNLTNFTSSNNLNISSMFSQSGLREIRLSQTFSPETVTGACNGLGTSTEHCHIYCSSTLADRLRTGGEARETVEFHTTE